MLSDMALKIKVFLFTHLFIVIVLPFLRLFYQNIIFRVVELTGDITPDIKQLLRSDLIVTTPEKWDGISRSWQHRSYVRQVALIIIDEIHLLGEERGPVLEVSICKIDALFKFESVF